MVVGDAFRLRQILLNLLGNALKFTTQGSIEVGGGAMIAEGRLMLRFSVRDTGIGIPPEKQAVIFEPFRQADSSTTRVYGGTGLGLAISARLVAALGGEIRVESEPGKGSCFHFTVEVQRTAVRENGAAVPQAAAPRPIAPLRVLLAEDNPINQTVAVHLLRKEGFTVEVASHGAEAAARVQEEEFDLVLMDIQMPEMDGLAATALIREREKGTGRRLPIIALTAHAMAGDRERCLAAGMDAYLAKPIQPRQLLEAIQQLLSGARAVASPERREA
jgi:CheY-like chemotaxis protein